MTFPVAAETESFIRALPKTENHLHFEATVDFDWIRSLEPDRFKQPPASWDKDFRFPDFLSFEKLLLDHALAWHNSPERYYENAKSVFARLMHEQNVRYLETSIASGVGEFLGVDMKACAEALKAAKPEGLELRIFLGIHHDGYNEQTQEWLEDSVNWEALDGLDLHGLETVPVDSWAARLWEKTRANGKLTKAHAGEFDGPGFMKWVLDELKVTCIEHGLRAVEDPALVTHLAEKGIRLDLCPISNVKLKVIPDYNQHPIKYLIQQGVQCTVSTDDPIAFGNTLYDEYSNLVANLGFSHTDLAQVARTGFAFSHTDQEWKAGQLQELDRLVTQKGGNSQINDNAGR